jgi:hypothetical protein
MKVGDLVKFTDHFNRIFYGHTGLVLDVKREYGGDLYLAVQWLKPVKYYGEFATTSHFNAERFEVIQ